MALKVAVVVALSSLAPSESYAPVPSLLQSSRAHCAAARTSATATAMG